MPKLLRMPKQRYKHKVISERDRLQGIIAVRRASSVKDFVLVRIFDLKLSNPRLDANGLSDKLKLQLSERDSEFFISVMENPPEPSEGLLSLFD